MKYKLLVLTALLPVWVQAQTTTDTDRYIERYKYIAVREMDDFGIPASITLAQGILESASGTSPLAVEANNHFGIKCHKEWDGGRYHHDDDKSQECFRTYDTPEESFVDHSQFLKNRSRYAFLFELSRTDYKGWAKGLKQAGYATDPGYAHRLIDLIQRYGLMRYDSLTTSEVGRPKDKILLSPMTRVKYVLAQKEDTYYTIAQRYHLPVDWLYRCNDVEKDGRLPAEGEPVYLRKKKTACDECPDHIVQSGESMYSIAQHYGIQLIKLYDLNNMDYHTRPKVGQCLRLK